MASIITKIKSSTILQSIIFILTTSFLFHFLFSSLGFNPTDDGFTLAYSQRIFNGEIPHKDFIIIRPALSPLLHLPEILIGGNSALWFSRFIVWIQLATISWFSLMAILNFTQTRFKLYPRFLIALISLMLISHNFPLTAWHTIDGLFLISIGLYLLSSGTEKLKTAGYFMLALSYLAKQSFIFVAPFTIIFLLDHKNRNYWFAAISPALLYLFFLTMSGSLSEGITQLTTQSNYFFYVAAGTYFNIFFCSGFLLGALSVLLKKKKETAPKSFPVVLFVINLLFPLLFILYTFITGNLLFDLSFYLFGFLSGTIFLNLFYKNYTGYEKTGIIVLLIAWSSGISLGYHFPILFSGPILVMIIVLYNQNWNKLFRWEYSAAALSFITILLLIAFYQLRTNNIYRDHFSSKLNYELDSVLPAGNNIFTSNNTYKFLSELDEITDSLVNENKKYTLLPDVPAFWVNAELKNPLPIDWANNTELNSDKLMERMKNTALNLPDDHVFIIQKFRADSIAFRNKSFGDSYMIVNFVRDNLIKTGEKTFFEFYKNKGQYNVR